MIERERIKILNEAPVNRKGKYVLYFMQASQRLEYNDAANFAAEKANELGLPLVTAFSLIKSFPGANLRHYAFMLEGLKEVSEEFTRRKLTFIALPGDYEDNCIRLAKEAALVVTDWGYLRFQVEIRKRAAAASSRLFIAVESDVTVPCAAVSDKREPYAMTFRPKLLKLLPVFLKKNNFPDVKNKNNPLKIKSLNLNEPEKIFPILECPLSPGPSPYLKGGRSEALKKLKIFIAEKLQFYQNRSDPGMEFSSGLSPYLHFGQISPAEVSLSVMSAPGIAIEAKEKFLDEILVWRELARNFLTYEKNYDSLDGLPSWAAKELEKREKDIRPVIYSMNELEKAKTGDRWWNTAQKELLIKGSIHNYMRMYWGKKIIEWTPTYKDALNALIYLNDKYAIDGRDPNGYASILWCFGLHDRPFFNRPVFGKIRYMNSAGLERKFNMEKYAERISNLNGFNLL
ncbi:MAG: deoxyribodipyrimidine photo-lyase [Elusimicrobiota bacterium]